MITEPGPQIAVDGGRVIEETLSEWSHDLRSQLAAVSLNIDAALTRVHGRGSRARDLTPLLEQAREIVKETVALMDDFLSEAREQIPGRVSSPQAGDQVDLRDLIHGCIARHGAALQGARCPVTVHCESGVVGPWRRGSLLQIVSNLLVNATKYAAGQPIEVEVTRVGVNVVLRIADGGPGFLTSDIRRAASRPTEGGEGRRKGFGLGLWIVSRAVQRLGGTLRVSSAPGRGAAFSIELPTSPARESMPHL